MVLPGSEEEVYALVPGLEASVAALASVYRAGGQGICLIDGRIVVTLPIPRAFEYTYYAHRTVIIGAGQTAPAVMWTVPDGEMNRVIGVRASRSTGDNTVDNFSFTMPDEWMESADEEILFFVTTVALLDMNWPDSSGIQANVTLNWDALPWLPAGTAVNVSPSGAGAAAGNWSMRLLLERTRIHPARLPS